MMKTPLFLLAALASVNAHALLFGVKLVSLTEHPMTTGFGTTTSAAGAQEGGLIASETYGYSQNGYGTTGGGSSASDSFDISLDVYWLKFSDNDAPPGTLYLNQSFGGSCYNSATYSQTSDNPYQHGFGTSTASSSAGKITPANADATGNPGTSVTQSMGFWTTSTAESVTWIVVGSANGGILYKIARPISFTTPSVSAKGTCYISSQYPASHEEAHGLSSGGLGISHVISVTATSQITAGGAGGGTPPRGGGSTPPSPGNS